MSEREPQVYGSTGKIGVDGILNPDQAAKLDTLQRDTAREAFVRLDAHQPGDLFPMAAMATGIGKGRIIHLAIEEQMRRKPDSRVMVIAGTKKMLIHQTTRALHGYQDSMYVSAEEEDRVTRETEIGENPLAGQSSLLYRVGRMGQPGTNVEVETIQKLVTLNNHGDLFPKHYDLLVADEVHNLGTPGRKEVAQRFKKALGFTATVHRHSGVLKHPEDYGFEIFKDYPLPQAQEDGLLPPLLGMQIDTKGLIDAIPTTKNGSIDYRALERMLKASPKLRPYITDTIAGLINPDPQTHYKTVVAVNYVWEAQEIAKLMHERGISAGLLINDIAAREVHTKEIPARDSLERYFLPHDHPDAVQVLISPYIAGEGFDAPFTEVLAWASPTDSGLRYGQYNSRLARRANGKAYGIVVDFLYQTDQYRWSYNMRMWMKGTAQQLDSGLLYVGANRDRQSISQHAGVRNLGDSNGGTAGFLAGSQEEFADLQPDDIVLTSLNLAKVFKGNRQRLGMLAEAFQRRHAEEHPEYFAIRSARGGNKAVITSEGRSAFVAYLQNWNILPVDVVEADLVDEVPEGSLALLCSANTEFPKLFDGVGMSSLRRKVVTVIASLRAKYPDDIDRFIVQHKVGGKIVNFVTPDGRDIFMKAMQAQGAVLKEETETSPMQSSVQPSNLETLFIGDPGRVQRTYASVMDKLSATHPEWVVQRDDNDQSLSLVADEAAQDYFFAAMEDQGVYRRIIL